MKIYFKLIIFYILIIGIALITTSALLSTVDKNSAKLAPGISKLPVINKLLPLTSPEVIEKNPDIADIARKYTNRYFLVSIVISVTAILALTPVLIMFIRKSVSEAKDVARKSSDLVSSVTHELRSPLTSINMYIDLLFRGDSGELNDTQTEYLTIMKDSAKRLTLFINDLLDIAKLEQGKLTINKQAVDLREIIMETLGLIRPQAHEKNIKLKLVMPSNLPKVSADQERTKQVITNLASNAIKFTKDGSVTVEAKDLKPGYVQVSVIDTGTGIPPDQLNSVFERFVQVTGTKKKVSGPKGTGLGLAIAKGIVEMQGGKIWIESEVGKGTTFHFTVPRHG